MLEQESLDRIGAEVANALQKVIMTEPLSPGARRWLAILINMINRELDAKL